MTGKAPELWYADTGWRVPASYRIEGGRTIVPLQLDPLEAVFVVFREPTTVAERRLPTPVRSVVATLDGPW